MIPDTEFAHIPTRPENQLSRRYFSPEFKVETTNKVLDDGMSSADACQTFDVDVGATAVRRWVTQLKAERSDGTPKGSKPIAPEQPPWLAT